MMDKKEISNRIEKLIREYELKKETLEKNRKKFEKLKKSRKVRKYLEFAENINDSNKDLNNITQEVAALEQKLKDIDNSNDQEI